jgi:hypothetical protein
MVVGGTRDRVQAPDGATVLATNERRVRGIGGMRGCKEKRNHSQKNFCSATSSITNPKWTTMEQNPTFCYEKPATKP